MQDGSVHDYMFDQESCDWVHWMKTVPTQELPPTLAFHEIIVQTIDTVRYSYLMRLLITHGHHTLFTGVLPMHSCNTCISPHCYQKHVHQLPSLQQWCIRRSKCRGFRISSTDAYCHCRCNWYWQDSLHDVSDQCIGQQRLPEHSNSFLSTDKRQPDSGHH